MVTTAPTLHLQALTHPGWVRSVNEDAHGLHAHARLAILADGLGGGRAGEVAAAMAVGLLGEALAHSGSALHQTDVESEPALMAREQAMRQAVSQVNQVLHRHAHDHPSCAGMGTTLVMAHWCGTHLVVGHVGDSRAYLLRTRTVHLGGRAHHRVELLGLTRDHSTHQRAADSHLALRVPDSSETLIRSEPARLTRALGVESDVVLELHRHRLAPGDGVLLCSDGLTDMVGEAQLESVLHAAFDRQPPSPARLERATTALLQAALDAGGRDNITVILGLQTDST